MSQILKKWIADNAIDQTKIDSAALGDGLAGGSGTVLSVRLGTGLEFVGGAISVTTSVTTSLQAALDAEIARATAAEGDLATRMTTAESDIDALEGRATTLETGLAQELVDRAAADTTNANAIAAEVTRAEAQEAAIRSEFAAADVALADAAEAAIKSAVEGAKVEVMYALTAADITATSFTIPGTDVPVSAGVVEIVPVGGIKQINAANVGTSGATADYSVTGSVVTLSSSIFEAGDVLMVSFIKETTVALN